MKARHCEKRRRMSYRLQSVGEYTPDVFRAGYLDYTSGGKDGVVQGILDEMKIDKKDLKIIIGRGKLMVSGYPVLFEGKEVIGIPSDYAEGDYMIVGVLTVSGYRATSFYLSLRRKGDIRCDEINKTGEGIYEIKIAQFSLYSKKIYSLKSLLNVIFPKPEQVGPTDFEIEVRSKNAKNVYGTITGTCNITDSQEGYLSDFKLKGKTVFDNGRIVTVPSKFTMNVHGKNHLDIRYIYDYEQDGDKQIATGNTDGGYFADGTTVYLTGIQNNSESVTSLENGYLRIHPVGLEEGKDYTLSFNGYITDAWWDVNTENVIAVNYKYNGELVKSIQANMYDVPEEFTDNPEMKAVELTFTAGKGENVLEICIGGMQINLHNLQLEQSSSATEYEPFVQKTFIFNLVDKNGREYELCQIDGFSDRIELKNGKVMLIRRIGKEYGQAYEVEYESHYITKNGIFVSDAEQIYLDDEDEVVYFVKNYEEEIELDISAQKWQYVPTYDPSTVITFPELELAPEISAKYGRNVALIIKSLEERIKALEG